MRPLQLGHSQYQTDSLVRRALWTAAIRRLQLQKTIPRRGLAGMPDFGRRRQSVSGLLPHPARSMADRGKHKVVLEPDPEQGPVVERIFREFVFGEGGIRGIASDLNRDGIPSARGGPWTGAAVSGILDNPKSPER
jgi:hypothetical protein